MPDDTQQQSGRMIGGSRHLHASLMLRARETRPRCDVFRLHQHHFDRQRYRRTVGYHCVQDKNATARAGRVGRSGSGSPRHHDRASRSLSFSTDRGPAPGGQGVEETLTNGRGTVGYTGRLENLAREGDGPREIDQRSVDLGPLAK